MLNRSTATGGVRPFSWPAILAVALGMVVFLPQGAAWAQTVNLCAAPPDVRQGGWLMDVSYHPHARAVSQNNLKQLTLAAHYIPMDGDALVFVTGVAHITDGTSNTILFSERYALAVTCADVDGDLIAGVAAVQLFLRDMSTGELVPMLIVPKDGELDDFAEEAATIQVGRLFSDGSVRFIKTSIDRP